MAEDDENDAFFVRRAVERMGSAHTLHVVQDGEEAIRYLRGEGEYADRHRFPMPNVIMTDLKMPRMNGFEFMRWLQGHAECTVIPIIVYSSSNAEHDVRQAYILGANAYITKPIDLNRMVELLELICAFWSKCEVPSLPQRCA